MAEVIKAGAIKDAALFAYLEQHVNSILALSPSSLLHIVWRSVAIKAEVVSSDEREGSLRAILNFGHSIGHAIEALMQPHLLHGECVAIGMMSEARIARAIGAIHDSSPVLIRLEHCLTAFGLPIHVPPYLQASTLVKLMGIDKKNKGRCAVPG